MAKSCEEFRYILRYYIVWGRSTIINRAKRLINIQGLYKSYKVEKYTTQILKENHKKIANFTKVCIGHCKIIIIAEQQGRRSYSTRIIMQAYHDK